jgi:hypothetical protein
MVFFNADIIYLSNNNSNKYHEINKLAQPKKVMAKNGFFSEIGAKNGDNRYPAGQYPANLLFIYIYVTMF